MQPVTIRSISTSIVPLFSAVGAAVVAVFALVAICGYSPTLAGKALLEGSLLTSRGLATTAASTIPLLFTGLAVALAFRGGALNIGAEGQYLAGALAAVAVGVKATWLPPVLLLPAAILCGAAAGSALGAIAGALRVYRNVPEVLSTIMLNFVMIHLVSWAVHGPLMAAGSGLPQSEPLPESARFTAYSPRHDLHSGVWLAVAMVGVSAVLIWKTTLGFRLRAVGLNPIAALHAGIPVRRTMLETMAISGAMAGLGGAVELSGVTHRFYENFSSGYGYTGIAVAMLGQLNPFGVAAAALFFGALAAGSSEMQRPPAEIPSVIVFAVQGVAVLFSVSRGWPAARKILDGKKKDGKGGPT